MSVEESDIEDPVHEIIRGHVNDAESDVNSYDITIPASPKQTKQVGVTKVKVTAQVNASASPNGIATENDDPVKPNQAPVTFSSPVTKQQGPEGAQSSQQRGQTHQSVQGGNKVPDTQKPKQNRKVSQAVESPAMQGNTLSHRVEMKAEQTRQQSQAPGSQPWVNRAEEIIKSEIGTAEFNKRLERQNTLFKKGCKPGGFTDLFSLYMLSSKLKGDYSSKTKETQHRATHAHGIGSLGYSVFEPDPRIPSNEFFIHGRVYEVRARNSSCPWSDDDRRMGFRSLALKFADHNKDSPLDLILQTGYLSPHFNGDAIEDQMAAREKGGEHVKQYLLSLPIYMQATIDGLRKRPESYYAQHYHSQMVFDFNAKDDKKRVGRIRCVPSDGTPESGRLTYQDQRDAWYFMLMDQQEQDIPPNYLKIEFAERIRAGPISYKLQIQLHDIGEEDDHMVYNPSIPWDAAEHPWMNLASIHLTAMLPNDVIELTRFNIGQLPSTLSFPEATSVYDFNIVPNLRQETYEYCQKLRPLQPPDEDSKTQEAEYLIHFVTGDHPQAGNVDAKCNVYVSIVGTNGRTPHIKLVRKTKNDFAVGAQATFCVANKNVADFVCLKIYKDKKGTKSDWLCDHVIFTTPYNNRCYKLPCYRWLTDDTPALTLRSGKACIDSAEKNSYLLLIRSLEVAHKRGLYTWHDKDSDSEEELRGFPGYLAVTTELNEMPHDFRLQKLKTFDTEWSKHIAAASSFTRTIKNMFKSRIGSVESEYCEVVTSLMGKELPASLEYVITHWKDDAEFVRQLVNMCAPLKITELQSLPENLPVSEAMVAGILDSDRTLSDELQDGNIFIITFPELEEFAQYDVTEEEEAEMESLEAKLADDNVSIADSVQLSFDVPDESKEKEANKQKEKSTKQAKKKPKAKPPKILRKYLCAPQVLLWKKNGELLPLAIQLSQKPTNITAGDEGDVIRPAPVIYTMKDSGGDYSDWLVAKMWVKTAAAHTHHISMHILGCHLLVEPLALAVFRNLPSAHPVYKILAPHLRHIVAINAIYRRHVIPHEKALSEFLGIGEVKGHLHDFIRNQYGMFKLNLLSVPDSYAERGVLEEDTVPGYYYRDDSLRVWEALHAYSHEILSLYYADDNAVAKDDELAALLTDLRRNGIHRRSDIPERISTLPALVHLVTNIIYRCSVHHSVTCNMMTDVYAFTPNAPPTMMRPPPRAKRGSAGWEEDVVRFMLPPPDLVERYIDTIQLMNKHYEEALPLGHFSEHLFTEEKPPSAATKLIKRLQKGDQEISDRNSGLEVPFEYFMSKNILSSIFN